MENIILVTHNGCSACLMAKNILNSKKIEYVNYNLDDLDNGSVQKFYDYAEENGIASFPAIFIDGEYA